MSGLKKDVNLISVKLAKVFGPNFWGRFIGAAFTNISYKPIFLASGNSLCVSSRARACARVCVCVRARAHKDGVRFKIMMALTRQGPVQIAVISTQSRFAR